MRWQHDGVRNALGGLLAGNEAESNRSGRPTVADRRAVFRRPARIAAQSRQGSHSTYSLSGTDVPALRMTSKNTRERPHSELTTIVVTLAAMATIVQTGHGKA